jgi:ketosteroid isomerase-like protein
MNTRSSKVSLVVIGVVLALGACARQPQATVVDTVADTATDEAAIRGVLDGIASTFNAGRYDEMFALYRDDVVVSPPNAPDLVGKQNWRSAMEATIPQNLALNLRFDTQELEVVGDMAYERGTYRMEAADKESGTVLQTVSGRHIHIFKREADGSWKGWRLFENSADPVPAAAATPQAGQ